MAPPNTQWKYAEGDTVVERHEYLSDVFASNGVVKIPSTPAAGTSNKVPIDFYIQGPFPINPGLVQTFPWLGQIAQNYTIYQFQQLTFHYKARINPIGSSNNGQAGVVCLAARYNVDECTFRTKEEMLRYSTSVSTDACENCELEVNVLDKDGKPANRYIRQRRLSPREDRNDYDLAGLQVGLINVPEEAYQQLLGEIWVTYKVLLMKPKLYSGLGYGILQDTYVSCNSNIPTTHALGGTSGLLKGYYNNLGTQVLTNTADQIQIFFPQNCEGFYEILWSVNISANSSTIDENTGLGYCNSAQVYGPIRIVQDVYGQGGYRTNDVRRNVIPNYGGPSPIAGLGTLQLIAHVKVSTPSPRDLDKGGSMNACFVIRTLPGQLVIQDAPGLQYPTLIIRPYNADLSSAANTADTQGVSFNPTLVNNTGTIVNGYTDIPQFSLTTQVQRRANEVRWLGA